jgi:hypothetical protein
VIQNTRRGETACRAGGAVFAIPPSLGCRQERFRRYVGPPASLWQKQPRTLLCCFGVVALAQDHLGD